MGEGSEKSPLSQFLGRPVVMGIMSSRAMQPPGLRDFCRICDTRPIHIALGILCSNRRCRHCLRDQQTLRLLLSALCTTPQGAALIFFGRRCNTWSQVEAHELTVASHPIMWTSSLSLQNYA